MAAVAVVTLAAVAAVTIPLAAVVLDLLVGLGLQVVQPLQAVVLELETLQHSHSQLLMMEMVVLVELFLLLQM